MSEFKFACPVCGQHIQCEPDKAGSHMECPTCFRKLIVPQQPSTTSTLVVNAALVQTRSIPTTRAIAPTAPASAPAPQQRKLPVVALAVALLVCGAALGGIVFRDRISRPRQSASLAPPPVVVAKRTNAVPARAADTNWLLNLDDVVIPDSVVAGMVNGKALVPQRVIVDGGVLTLRTPNPGPPELGVSIYLHASRGEDLADQTVNIRPDAVGVPWVNLRWKNANGDAVTQTIKQGYAMRIEFGSVRDNKLSGKIYLCTPDDAKSYLDGTFAAEIRKPAPPKGGPRR